MGGASGSFGWVSSGGYSGSGGAGTSFSGGSGGGGSCLDVVGYNANNYGGPGGDVCKDCGRDHRWWSW